MLVGGAQGFDGGGAHVDDVAVEAIALAETLGPELGKPIGHMA